MMSVVSLTFKQNLRLVATGTPKTKNLDAKDDAAYSSWFARWRSQKLQL